MNERLLFIGGPHDGKWEEVDEKYSYVRVATQEVGAFGNVGVTCYKKQVWRNDDETFFLMIHESISLTSVFLMLLEGYRKP